MDADLWSARLAAAKRQYTLQQNHHHNQSPHLDRLGIDDYEVEEEIRPDFPCPYCYEDYDIVSLCSHLEDEHSFESKVTVCPICSVKVSRDMLNHITLQHGHLFKLQRRRRLRRVAIPGSQALSLLGRDLREAHLQVLLGGGGYRSSNNNTSNVVTDSFLSSLAFNFPTSEAEEIAKSAVSSVGDTSTKNLSTRIWKSSFDSLLSSEERESEKTNMAELYNKEAKSYAESRPSYPSELFQFIASKTLHHDLAWDVGTGSGQAAASLAGIYKRVVATDTSLEQLTFARQLPNIHYVRTPPNMSLSDLTGVFSTPASVDLVTVATALHWFDLPSFYEHVKWVLRRPGGVFAVWTYKEAVVDQSDDAVYSRVRYIDSAPFWAAGSKFADDEYRDLDFPFEPAEGEEHTGPFRFEAKKQMNLDMYLGFIRSWSGYQTARAKGVELLSEEVVRDFEHAWGANGSSVKTVTFPIHMRLGRVVN